MYDEATARKMLKAAVLLSAEAAKYDFAEDVEPVIGFDPDDAALDNVYIIAVGYSDTTPMIHFAEKGDAKMCLYLISRGASTTKSTEEGLLPMHAAAQQDHLEVCKLLQTNGASNDIWKEDSSGWTPFHLAAAFQSHDELVRWLVLQGALCVNANSEEIEGNRIFPEICGVYTRNSISYRCKRLVEWAKAVTQSNSAVVMFLLGTLPRAPDKDQNRTLQCLNGHPGVRKHISDFVGLKVTKARQLRILRQVVDVLPSLIN